mmetsp:Transcript_31001/g.101057  ORF Transcript_31001/g.101057 Transcript_31001/m.101057 type:complete len:460 (-) Transcript_31001:64-1443(-)
MSPHTGTKRQSTDAEAVSGVGSGVGVGGDGALFDVSVLMPVRNAMPWLPSCVASVLGQEGVRLELIAVDDTSDDGSREWLQELEAAQNRGEEEERGETERRGLGSDERAPKRARREEGEEEAADEAEAWDATERLWEPSGVRALTPAEVLRRRRAGNVVRVLTVDQKIGPSGQGRALNVAFKAARANLIGEMESDDLRPPDCFRVLADALAANRDWDAATSLVRCCGMSRPKMEQYIAWQNSLRTPEEFSRSRFIEIPALRGAGLYRRSALERLGPSVYRDLWIVDGEVCDCADADDPRFEKRPELRPRGWWPVDSDFWMRFLELGLRAGKVPRELYLWRQYPAQSTRTHSRCSLDQLRQCKAVFFVRALSLDREDSLVQVWGVGETLAAWVRDLRAAGAARVEGIEYNPKSARPDPTALATGVQLGAVRVFPFGTAKMRKLIPAKFPGFDTARDWHAA